MVKLSLLFVAMTLFSCIGQTNQSNGMKNRAQSPKILFEKQCKLLLQKENGTKYYLRKVTIEKPTNYYPELDSVEFSKVKFTMNYNIETKSKLSSSGLNYVAHFAKDSDSVNYKIFESSYLSNWVTRDNIFMRFKEMSFQANLPELSFVGYSDNETLQAVTVWNYVNEHFDYENAVLEREE